MPAELPCLHEIFEQRVAEGPNKPAISFEGETLTYGELNQRANRLAHRLKAGGLGQGQFVGLCLERGLDTVTAILAVLKVGAAYVPMDPSNPAERVRMIARDAQCALLLVQSAHKDWFTETFSDIVLELDTSAELDNDWPACNLEAIATGDALAYVIYTSGSTGKPKGVPIPHRNVARLFKSTSHWFDFSEKDTWTLFHSFAFDFSVWELWGALLHGGRLVVVPYWISRSPEDFHRLLRDEGVTVLNQTPSAFAQLQAHDATLLPELSLGLALRYVIFGGEALSFPGLATWFDRHGDAQPQLINMYGITETTIHVTYRRVLKEESVPGTPSYIGVPIPDQPCYVVKHDGELAAIGEEGELYVGGAGNAIGYLNRPELTAERFIERPFFGEGNQIFYKSGDLVRRLDGDLVYLGRIDRQVQVRGFRVELGEIESSMLTCSGVQGVAVRIVSSDEHDHRLIAYYVSDAQISATTLRENLTRQLPEYMIPSVFMRIEKIPLTGNGKTDYQALPEPVFEHQVAEFVAPRNEIERTLVSLWQELLRVPKVGIEDNFFALGGHSLLATRLLLQIHERFHVRLTLRDLFEQTTVAALARRLEIEWHQQDNSDATELPRADRSGLVPLSFAQEQMWILSRIYPQLSAYNIPIRINIVGELDHDRLARALAMVLQRHEALRTTFEEGGDGPLARIHSHMEITVDFRFLDGLNSDARGEALTREALLLAKSAMNLTVGPLIRATHFMFSREHSALILLIHHANFDGWSVSILLEELGDAYASISNASGWNPEPLVRQYPDYATWQRMRMVSPEFEVDLAYWKKQLAGPLPVLQMPLDYSRPVIQTWEGGRLRHILSMEHYEQVARLANQLGTTPFAILLAGWKTLLFRHTGETDSIVGAALAGRYQRAWEPLIGFFVNAVAIRVRIGRDLSFDRLVKRVHETLLAAQTHQEVPFERVVAEVQRDRDPSRSPIFQTMIVLHNTPDYHVERGGLVWTAEELGNGGAKFELTLAMQVVDGALNLDLEYNTALFRPVTAEMLLHELASILRDATTEPARSVGHLHLGAKFAHCETEAPNVPIKSGRHADACLHTAFEEQVYRSPDAPAVTCDGTTLSYHEVNSRANRLAHYLRAEGVAPSDLVGLCLDRSIDTIVAILAVLKAGGAYVPMDPLYPEERVQMIVEDARCPIVLVHVIHAGRFKKGSQRLVMLDGIEAPWDDYPDSDPLTCTNPSSLAYVLYTSGSTGKPKGALITHWNVHRLITQMDPWFEFSEADVWTLFHSYAFDFSVWEMWGPFFHGARVVVVPFHISRSPEEFYQLLLDEKVTVLNQTPSAFKQLQRFDETVSLEQARCLSLRYVIFGGECLDFPGLSGWFDRHGETTPQLVNMYGITETTVFVTYRPVTRSDTKPGTPSFIGIPIPDLTLHVLDDRQQPVAAGQIGELYVGGDGVGLGYLRRPELNAERFLPDPLNPSQGERKFYKTGDLVRLRDNDLEFIGRNDNQVQLRGFRIELGDIEVAIGRIDTIEGVIVRMREDVPGDQRLVAYYLASSPQSVEELRARLSSSLPAYMVPSNFVHLEAFPLNNNGKIDVSALPKPETSNKNQEMQEECRSNTEYQIAAIWQDLLRCDGIKPDDNFFAVGGHSLLLVQLTSRIRDRFQIELPLGLFMRFPTVRAQAVAVDDALESGTCDSLRHPIPISDRNPPIPLSSAQERIWIIEHVQPGNNAYHIPLLITITGPGNADYLKASLHEVLCRHEALRTVFATVENRPVQVIHAPAKVDIHSIPLDESVPYEELDALARKYLIEADTNLFALDHEPPLRVSLMRAAHERWYIGFVVHHILFDGWSIRVLLDEWAQCYGSLASGQRPDLAPLPIQYADYAVWQRQSENAAHMMAHLDYWRAQLAAPVPVLELPLDFSRPPLQSPAGKVAERLLDTETSSRLTAMAAERGITLFTLLLAGWKILLHRYSGQNDIVVGTFVAGRTHQILEGLIGDFVNSVAIRTSLSAKDGFEDYLERLNIVANEALEHQDVPFDRVVAVVVNERDASRSPLFQVAFVLQNTPEQKASAAGLTWSAETVSNGSSKFDLTLNVNVREECLLLSLEYCTALYRAGTAERMLGSYETLVKSILERPSARLGELQIVAEPERALLLDTLTSTESPFDRTLSLIDLFEEVASKYPELVAVADDNTHLTYRALDEGANRIAHYLLSLGVTKEEPVPFFLNRSVQVIMLIIGILKAGAAFVPLDLLDPPKRRERVLQVLQPRIVLTESSLLSQISVTSATLQCLDDNSLLEGFPACSPGIVTGGENLAYVFFTSGSTGDPKGVSCTHQGVINLYLDLQARCPVGPGDACSLWTAFSFDISVYESWTSLLAGASLHIIPERVRPNPKQCLEWLRERKIATGYIQGFMLSTLLEMQREDPIPLRRLLVGLEPLPESLLCEILEATPGLVLLNWYGPTEAAIYCTLYQVHDQRPRPEGNAPIGKPIQNMRMYVLDPNQNLLPIGVPGELYIGGVGLARGYYNDPELTERQFVPDPFTHLDTRRLYRSGDLVYVREDGNIQFIRRMGRYIKLRGFRIEPGEIESILRTHPDVDDAVVVLFDKGPGEPRILAYLVTRQDPTQAEASVTAFLKDRLPAHMCPAQYLCVEALPRTVQGKLDRSALPDPPSIHSNSRGEDPANETEEGVLDIWRDCLSLDEGGVNSSFFALGGHSLLAIEMLGRVNKHFESNLSLAEFFDAPTVAGLASHIRKARNGMMPPETFELREFRSGHRIPLFCLPGAGDVGSSYSYYADGLSDDQPLYGYANLDYRDGKSASLEELASRCIKSLKAVRPQGPYYLGGFSFGGTVAYEMARQLLEGGEEVPFLAMLDSGTPDHFTLKPALSAHYLRCLWERARARCCIFGRTWKLHVGYLRDGLRLFLSPSGFQEDADRSSMRLVDYLRWLWVDASFQYYLIQAGLARPTIAERRTSLFLDQVARARLGSMQSSQQPIDEYDMVPIPVEITLFRASHSPYKSERRDPTYGWSRYALKGVRIVEVPGNHMAIMRPPLATGLGQALQRMMDEMEHENSAQ